MDPSARRLTTRRRFIARLSSTPAVSVARAVRDKTGQDGAGRAYELFDSYRHDRDASAIVARLALARAERGLSAPLPLGPAVSADAERAMQAVEAGAQSPNQSLGALLEQTRNRLERTVQGWVVETTSLDAIRFPEALTLRPALGLTVTVGHYKPAGQPWGRFVVFIVMTSEATPTVTARAGAAHAG
jgi:hypothetical protein